ncbi:plasmid stabilization protein [Methylobacterium tardum]|uniref:FitA-like ribbon-helix-helix domain-containing protein n=1 Tax=Methylobacterium tardum TaxID=374432 RepID=UPI002021E613|nr:plasmid stabilization protein [Methylobacterium tardum]URD37896.1 plasmid stabilization protein [Methylobacterium tardum]
MAQLVVRNLAESVKVGLRRRAERHGRSVEAEVREILQAAIGDDGGAQVPLGSRIAARFSHVGFGEEIREQRGTMGQPAVFE